MPRRGRRAAGSDAGRVVHDPGRRGTGRPHRDRQRQARPGRRARAVPRQPPARLPGLRQGRRVPAAGPDAQPRSRREPLRRAEAPLREADPDQRPGVARPRALHPVRPLHALRRRGGRRQADPLRQSRQRHPGDDVPRRAVRVVLLRQHRADLPGRRAHRHAVPVQGQAVGSRAGREHVHHVLGRLPRRDPVEPRRAAALPGRRLRPGQLGLAVRPRPVRLRGGQLRRSASPPRWCAASRASSRRRGAARWRSPRRSFARRSTPVGRTRSDCSAVLAARTRMRTRGPSSPTPSASIRRDAQMGDGLPPEVLGLDRATIDEAANASTIVLIGPDLKEELPVLYLRLRDAAEKRRSRILEISPTESGLTNVAWKSVRYEPGGAARVISATLAEPDVAEQLGEGQRRRRRRARQPRRVAGVGGRLVGGAARRRPRCQGAARPPARQRRGRPRARTPTARGRRRSR